ncbi:MAG: hypothetical protein ACRDSN_19965 [Pseudonocardiaceae bacterium]
MTDPTAGNNEAARRLLGAPYRGNDMLRALELAEAQTCAILAVADAIEELTRQITGGPTG